MGTKLGPRPCATSGRTMRPGGTTVKDHPQTIGYGRDGSCTTCIARLDRGAPASTPHDGSAPVHLSGGSPVQLVRWTNTRDGWSYDLVTGQYRGRDQRNFYIIVSGSERPLPRDQWEVCSA